jgi:hypothetical protein
LKFSLLFPILSFGLENKITQIPKKKERIRLLNYCIIIRDFVDLNFSLLVVLDLNFFLEIYFNKKCTKL